MCEERRLHAIVTATIVHWKVVEEAGKDWCKPCVAFKCCEMMCFFIGHGASSSDLSPIIAQYINNKAKNDAERMGLLTDAANGLLQVIIHQRVTVTTPPVPVLIPCEKAGPKN